VKPIAASGSPGAAGALSSVPLDDMPVTLPRGRTWAEAPE